MIVCTYTALKKPRKSLEEWKEVIALPLSLFGREFAFMAPQSSILVKKEKFGFPAGFRSSSQGQVNSEVTAKEHSKVHLCLGLALRKI
ncbi:unnamed protein product [Nezara viridula]|uniref:Uncharacterized protein n=1 Tax=Nezara viridula TaxID=85310 RepID=A0A9P0MVX6_NEZVI|nr:unnamed protein product [Nezara viridula]